ncbi:MAG: chemotaxis protein CheB, partial [Kofleriaceae bacterium]
MVLCCMVAPGFQVVVVGGTAAPPVLQVVSALAGRPGFAIIAWCPELDAAELRAASKVEVTELVDRAPFAANRVYLAPRDRRIAFEDSQIIVGGVDRSPLDLLFRSVADSIGARASAVILAGTGRDGSSGIQRIKEVGGLTMAQALDGAGAEMPGAAIESGLIDIVVPLAEVATQLVALARPDVGRCDVHQPVNRL